MDTDTLEIARIHVKEVLDDLDKALSIKRERAAQRLSKIDTGSPRRAGEMCLLLMDKGAEPQLAAQIAAQEYGVQSSHVLHLARMARIDMKNKDMTAKKAIAIKLTIDGQKAKDIAKRLDVSQATVYRWISPTHKAIRTARPAQNVHGKRGVER